MKPCKNWMLQFSIIFMTPGTWNLAKIGCFNFSLIFMTSTWNLAKISIYNFLQFSWPRVHETLQKSDALIFPNFHETLQKSDSSIFSNFHDPVYMKPLIFNFLSCKNEPFWKRSTCTDLLVGFLVGNFSQIKFRQYSNKLLLGMDNSRNEKAIHVSFFTYKHIEFIY